MPWRELLHNHELSPNTTMAVRACFHRLMPPASAPVGWRCRNAETHDAAGRSLTLAVHRELRRTNRHLEACRRPSLPYLLPGLTPELFFFGFMPGTIRPLALCCVCVPRFSAMSTYLLWNLWHGSTRLLSFVQRAVMCRLACNVERSGALCCCVCMCVRRSPRATLISKLSTSCVLDS